MLKHLTKYTSLAAALALAVVTWPACTHDNEPPALGLGDGVADAAFDSSGLDVAKGDQAEADALQFDQLAAVDGAAHPDGSGDASLAKDASASVVFPDIFAGGDDLGPQNQPPQVAWLLPAQGVVVQVGSAVGFVAVATDDMTSPGNLAVDVTLANGALPGDVQLAVDASGTISFATSELPAGKNEVVLTVADAFGLSSQATLTVLVNVAAGAPVVAIEPKHPYTTNDLQAVLLQPAMDQESGPLAAEQHSYQWKRFGKVIDDLTGPVVPAARTKAGEMWTVTVWGNDGSAAGLPALASVTIDNTGPGPVVLALQPIEVSVAATLQCQVASGAGDADGDPINYLVRWTLNGEELPEAGTSTTLALATLQGGAWQALQAVQAGDVIGCRVNPSDGQAVGPMAEVTAVLAGFDACTAGGSGCPAGSTVCQPTMVVAPLCPCAPGYVGPGGAQCQDVNECGLELGECATNSACVNTAGSYECLCAGGFQGDGRTAEGCQDVDDCAVGTAMCDLAAACSNTVGGYTCPCLSGYVGDGSQPGGCKDLDECWATPEVCDLAADCSNNEGGYACTCKPGYLGAGVGPGSCVDIDECKLAIAGCGANSVCTNVPGDALCTCADGYAGDGHTCTDINECVAGTFECDSHAICANAIGTYVCQCSDGWVGDGNTCQDLDECAFGLAKCSPNAACSNNVGGYACTCKSGFVGNGLQCTDIDECALGAYTCPSAATCLNTAGTYTCVCKPGYQGPGCSDIDECQAGSAKCDTHALCVNTTGSYACNCQAGWLGDGKTCSNVNECALGAYACHPHASCLDTDGSYLCKCDLGWTGDGLQCSDIDECAVALADCASAAVCKNTAGSYDCTCKAGWGGTGVGVDGCSDLDECLQDTYVCASEASCVNLDGDYGCSCGPGYTGDGKTCADIDECAVGLAKCDPAAVCSNTTGSYACACKPGWQGDGKTCKPAGP